MIGVPTDVNSAYWRGVATGPKCITEALFSTPPNGRGWLALLLRHPSSFAPVFVSSFATRPFRAVRLIVGRAIIALAAIALDCFAEVNAQSRSNPSGWWQATLRHAGESRSVWLHFQYRSGKLTASFSNPEIGAYDAPLGEAIVRPGVVELKDLGWTLQREDASGALTGVVPPDLIPVYRIEARFVRSAPPIPRIDPKPAYPPPAPLWQQIVGASVYAGLAFDPVHRIVIIATDLGRVIALGAKTGAIVWSSNAGGPIRATPLVVGRALYVPTDARLIKIDTATGKFIWSASIGRETAPRRDITDPNSRWDHYSSSAVLAGNSVYVGGRDGCVYRLGGASGAQLARYCAKDLITATPVVDGNRLYFGSFDKHVYAVNIDSGQLIWARDLQGEVPRDLAIAGGKILAGSRSYDLDALNMDTGGISWKRYYWFSWVDSPPVVMGHSIYTGSSDSLRVFAFALNGTKRWERRLPGWIWAKPAIGRSAIYAAVMGTSMPYIGHRAGGFAAVDRTTGRLRWLLESRRPQKARLYGFASAPIVAEHIVYAADLEGRIMAFVDQ